MSLQILKLINNKILIVDYVLHQFIKITISFLKNHFFFCCCTIIVCLAFIACVLSIENYIHFLKKCARFYTFFENLCTLKNTISYSL